MPPAQVKHQEVEEYSNHRPERRVHVCMHVCVECVMVWLCLYVCVKVCVYARKGLAVYVCVGVSVD